VPGVPTVPDAVTPLLQIDGNAVVLEALVRQGAAEQLVTTLGAEILILKS
jgi:hypothetical protein